MCVASKICLSLPQAPEERHVPVINRLKAPGEGKHAVPPGLMRGPGMRSLLHICRSYGTKEHALSCQEGAKWQQKLLRGCHQRNHSNKPK